MSEWHVSASESEGEGGRETKEEAGDLELGGLKIPTARMVELLQVQVVIIQKYCSFTYEKHDTSNR